MGHAAGSRREKGRRMKLKLNREYALRHLGVTILMFALGMYFLYDAIFVYPYLTEADGHHTTVEFQYSMAAILTLFSLIVGVRLLKNFRRTLEWDDSHMCGSVTDGVSVSFSDITHCDRRQWESKGIIVVYTKDKKHYVLDAWHHIGVKELEKKLPKDTLLSS
jgi:hypothetical protein